MHFTAEICFSLGPASAFQTSYLIMTIIQRIREESLLSSAGNKPHSGFDNDGRWRLFLAESR